MVKEGERERERERSEVVKFHKSMFRQRAKLKGNDCKFL